MRFGGEVVGGAIEVMEERGAAGSGGCSGGGGRGGGAFTGFFEFFFVFYFDFDFARFSSQHLSLTLSTLNT